MGLGRRQHGPSEFITIPDHDVPFGLGSLADYFVRASEPHASSDGIIRGLSTTQEAELQRLVQQLRLRDGAPGPSTSALIAPSSPDRTSLMTLCFPDETDEHGTFAEIEETIQPGLASSFDLFGVFAIELAEESLTAPALESGASDFVDPPLSFDVLSGFVSRSDVVFDDSSMDLSMFEPVDQRVSPAVGDTRLLTLARDQPRELRIGSISTDERDSLIQLLRSYLDVFAWSYEDMPGLDPSIVQHRERGDPEAAQCRILISGRVPGVAGQCRPCSQKDGKVRVCVDFRDLNKASPKDDFPLPHIDMLVDKDMEKTSFITEWGTYCYRVMPFGLKNAGATYQRAATTFHDMMHRDVEVYVDDMIVKSRDRSDHLAALESERGIEVDPDKIRAILTCLHRGQRERSEASWADFSTSCSSAFERIREYLLSPPVLAPPTPGRPYSYTCLIVALGCMLAQLDDSGKDRAIYY
ncbi:Transposon Ty3-I Gag-Pol polyprotein [Vitis vinifera]|uniref:Transposon Ty3-I Gag-Pol polyprotein n=1 Tax=Vitis vinifera TaxID=29760 RepID=A0A438JFT1_VITVI|nr:Transposon Ty3-I Gag-Pol polyprotein [Vitis vinifera]